jgi:hypothetical protein
MVGHATPSGARAVVIASSSRWSPALASTSASTGTATATAAGVASSIAALGRRHRLHGAALGIGERCGNTLIDLLMVNLVMGYRDNDLTGLPAYAGGVEGVRRADAPNYPVLGADAPDRDRRPRGGGGRRSGGRSGVDGRGLRRSAGEPGRPAAGDRSARCRDDRMGSLA